MKTLLVATDFSENANQAADYACKFAGQLCSNVQLIHASSIDTDSPLQVIWPIEDQETMIARNDAQLETFSAKLRDSVAASSGPDGYVPAIRVRSAAGEIGDLIRETVQLEDIAMVILGLSGNGDLKRLIQGSCSRDSIDFAEYPLMLIPKNVKFAPVKKIAFATDLSISDMEIIQLLALLAAKLNAELLIVHVIGNREGQQLTQRIDTFMKELKSRVNFNQMYYENVYQSKLEDGLNWLSDHGGTNIVAVIHRKHSSTSNVLHSSHAQKMARHTNLPLIVIPEGYKGMLF
ncbi:universal stress protein [Pedobacter sp. MC2016-05]|uniref:universal stress protein n=1 Tax=Pedobacter sp. MC2016-05 TaxID=2994474 RepID=UPI002247FE29|nr:universal stress protein [Pedobacter sp. MC2016-05]MCX2477277.1 universal stress protein [Pedobacter sp. MC2016-05]